MSGIDWTDTAFSLEKAYVCSLFAGIAYLHVPEYELGRSRRINVIPSDAYARAALGPSSYDLATALEGADFAESFIVERRFAIVVGIVTSHAIFISIRGTQDLYDWFVNARALRARYTGGAGDASFHNGFFRAIRACLEETSRELHRRLNERDKPLPIYLTGHSLGGAMAAIMNAVWTVHLKSEFVHEGGVYNHRVGAHSCYTYGMPRYGDANAVNRYREPFSVYNDDDVVPSIPPKWMGYEDGVSHFRLDGTALERVSRRETMSFVRWIGNLASGRGVAQHNMELYQDRLQDWMQKRRP